MKHLTLSMAIKASVSALALTGLLAADAAIAQDNDDEIVVTARRVGETLIEAPVAVSAFDDSTIEDLGLRSIDDVARHTAGFSFSQAFGRTTERPVIRGAANILAGVQFGVEAGAAYFIDGVYYSGDMQALDLKNLERVEVIKGPQSALYGRNTYSGAVNFVTRRASQGGTEGTFEGHIAEDDEYEIYGRVSTALVEDKVGFSLSGRYYDYGGDSAWKNAADAGTQLGSEETISLNGTLDVNFSDNFTVLVNGGYTEDRDGPRPFRLIGAEQNNCFPGYRSGAFYDRDSVFPFPTGFGNIFQGLTTPEDDSTNQYFCGNLSQFEDLAPSQNLNAGPFLGVKRDLLFSTVKGEYKADNGYQVQTQFGLRKQSIEAGSDSAHLPETIFFFPISPFFSVAQQDGVFYNNAVNDSFDYSAEIRLASPAENRVRWSVGAFIYDFYEEQSPVSFSIPTANNTGAYNQRRSVKNKAVFATLDFDVTEQLEFSLEGRYQEEEKGVVEWDNGLDQGPTYESAGKFTDFIPKAILSYDINDDASAYISYAKGIKPGGVNGQIGIPTGDEFYQPEKANAYEVGFKTRTGDGKGQVTISAFLNDISKYQLTTPVAADGALNSVATNQGDAEIKGVEIEGSYSLTDNFTVGGTYAYTDAKFTSGCDDFEFTLNSGGFLLQPFDFDNEATQGFIRNPADLSIGAGLTAPLTDPAGLFTGNLSCSIAGRTIPMTSEHQGSLYGRFEAPINDEMNFFTNIDFTHESSKFIQVHNGMETGDANIFGGQIGVKYKNARFEIFGRNLTNERTPPIATRWFDLLEGFNVIGTNPPFGVPAGAGRGSIDRNVTGPRSAFLSYRRGRQIGARVKVDF